MEVMLDKSFFENIASKIGVSTKNMISSSDVESISAIYLWNKELNVLVSISNELSKHIVLKIDSVHQNKISQLINFTVQANKNYEMATDLHINSRRYISAKLIIDNSSAIFETNNIWRSMLLSYSYILKSNHKNIHALICWDLRNRINAQTGFKFVISRNSFSSYVAIPKLKLSFDYDVTSNNEIDNNTDKKTSLSSSGSIFWINQTFFGFDTSYKSHSNLDKSYYIQNFSVCILFPNKAVKYLNDIKIINTHEILLENREIEVHDKHIIFWDALNDLQNNITLYSFSNKDQIKLGILHPKLNHRIEARLKRSKKLESIKHPSSLMFELEYSTDPRDLLVIDYYHVESIENEKSFESGLEISHLSSNIFHGFVVNATLTEEITEYYLNLKYDNPQDDTQNFIRLLGRIHRNKPMIEGFLENDLNKLSGIFSTWSENNTRGLIMQAVSNENLPLVFKASLNSGQNDPSINFNIVAGPSKSYNIFGAIPSNKEIVAYLEHDLYGSLSKDASFNLRLNTTTLIWTKIHWKTGIWKEIRDNILNEYDDLQYIVENIGQSFVCMIPDNAGEKLYRDINSVTSNLTADFEISFLKLYYVSSIGILNDMYQENHLYARTIADYINKTATNIIKLPSFGFITDLDRCINILWIKIKSCPEYYNYLQTKLLQVRDSSLEKIMDLHKDIASLKTYFKNAVTLNINKIKSLLSSLGTRTTGLLDAFEDLWRRTKAKVRSIFEPTIRMLLNIGQGVETTILDAKTEFINWLQEVQNYIYSIQELRILIDTIVDATSYIKNHFSQYDVQSTLDYLTEICDIVTADFQRLLDLYSSYCNVAVEAIIGETPYQYNRTEMHLLQNETNMVIQKIIWTWNYYNIPERVKGSLKYLKDDMISILNLSYNFLTVELLHLFEYEQMIQFRQIAAFNCHGFRNTIFRPDKGHIELFQYLPFEWEGFNVTPQFYLPTTFRESLQRLRRGERPNFNTEAYWPWLYSRFESHADLLRVPPPMYALLVGSSSYITFQGEYLEILNSCKYLVLADSIDDNFAIFVEHSLKNNKIVKDSVQVVVNGNTIKLEINGQISVNKIPRSLPYLMDDVLTIHRDHSILKLQYRNRYFMDWHLTTDVTVFTSKQWSRGNTIGLLGKEEDESRDVFIENNYNKTMQSTSIWNNRWHKCSTDVTNNSVTSDTKNIEIVTNTTACYEILQSQDSSLAKCYGIVDPKPCYSMCLNNQDVCASAQAYKTICEISGDKGLSLEKYESCRWKTGEMLSDSLTAVNAADVVFLVEEVNSLSFVDLSQLLLDLEKALLNKGIGLDDLLTLKNLDSTVNRYAIVGWGGDMGLKDPYTRTSLAHVWNSAQTAAELLTKISYGDTKDITRINIVRVLEYASGLQFRKGASKILVLLQGQECQGQEKYDDIAGILNSKDFTLHILEPDSIKPKTIDPKPTKVFGVDMNGGYTARHQEGALPDPKLLSKISIPRDQCTPATFESGGSLFNLDRAEDARFAPVWAQRVALSAKKHVPEQDDCNGQEHSGCKSNKIVKIGQGRQDFKAVEAEDVVNELDAVNDISVEYEDESFI